MIVVDASAAVLGLLNDSDAREALAAESLAVPHLADSEVANALRAQVARRSISLRAAKLALDRWRRLGVTRYPVVGLLDRVWELRSNLTAYDATYVALAEAAGCALLTGDRRLAAAPGPRCPITIVSR